MDVALLAEGVDRNSFAEVEQVMNLQVALLAEGVDRNQQATVEGTASKVALLAEGVDRNWPLAMLSLLWAGRPPRGGRG